MKSSRGWRIYRTAVSHACTAVWQRIPHLVAASMLLSTVAFPSEVDQTVTTPRVIDVTTYDRAAALLPVNLRRKIVNAAIEPHWIGRSDDFWYRRQTGAGYEFVRANAATGETRPAFDHQAIASGLAALKSVTESTLPFDSFTYTANGAAIAFEIDGREVRCALRPVKCVAGSNNVTPANTSMSPDGKWGVFSRDGNLWLMEAATRKERPLTHDGSPDNGYGIYPDLWKGSITRWGSIWRKNHPDQYPPLEVIWAPNSSTLIVPRIDQRQVAEYPFMDSAPDDSFRPHIYSLRVPLVGERPASYTYVAFTVSNGAQQEIALPDVHFQMNSDTLAVQSWTWSANCQRVYAVAYSDDMKSARLFDIDLANGAVRTVIDEQLNPPASLNPSYYFAANVQILEGARDVIWFSERDGWGQLYLYDGQTGKIKNRITSGAWVVREIADIDPVKRFVYFSASGREPGNPYYRYLYRAKLDGSDMRLLTPELADHTINNMSKDPEPFNGVPQTLVSPTGRYVVYTYSTVSEPPRTVIRAVQTGKLIKVLETADVSGIAKAGWRSPEEFTVKAADGKTDLYGVLYRPSNFDPRHRYPVIDVQYSSPAMVITPRNFEAATQSDGDQEAYAELGFIVMTIDPRGSPYRSQDFHSTMFRHLDQMGLDDHVAAIEQLARRYSYIDEDRVGIVGDSFGGWTVFRAMLGFPAFFKVGIAGSPAGAYYNQYQDRDWDVVNGWPIYSDGSPWRTLPLEKPANWTASDNIAQVDQLRGKLLIQMGEEDQHVLPGSTLQFISALIKSQKSFDMLYVPSTGHQLGNHDYPDLQPYPYIYKQRWDYFVKNLLGAEPPKEYTIQVAN